MERYMNNSGELIAVYIPEGLHWSIERPDKDYIGFKEERKELCASYRFLENQKIVCREEEFKGSEQAFEGGTTVVPRYGQGMCIYLYRGRIPPEVAGMKVKNVNDEWDSVNVSKVRS
jgi:hypothetical protein